MGLTPSVMTGTRHASLLNRPRGVPARLPRSFANGSRSGARSLQSCVDELVAVRADVAEEAPHSRSILGWATWGFELWLLACYLLVGGRTLGIILLGVGVVVFVLSRLRTNLALSVLVLISLAAAVAPAAIAFGLFAG